MKKRKAPLTAALLVCLVVILLLLVVDYVEKQRLQESLRVKTIASLSTLRAELEAEINKDFYLTRGLIAFVETNPGMGQNAFHRWSRNLLRHRNSIINIALAPNNIVSFVYPLERNAKALGLDYSKNKKQWPAVKRAIDSGQTVVAGPVKLIQGGSAFISRTPIYVDSPGREGDNRYWGLASIVIDKDKLLRAAGFYTTVDDIRVALRGKDGQGAEGGLIAGPAEIFGQNPVLLSVLLPAGSWQLAAIPAGGWLQSSPNLFLIRSLGIGLAMLLGASVFYWLNALNRSHARIEQAVLDVERANNALAKNEDFLNAIIENIPHMIFVKDAKDLRFVRFNHAGEELTGFFREQLLGRQIEDVLPADIAKELTEQDRRVLANKSLCDFPQETIETPHRGLRTFHSKKIPLLDADGKPEFLLGIAEDITDRLTVEKDRQKLEQKLYQAQKMEAIGLMAGGVAHDLNNILAAITGYPELLLRKLPDESEYRKPLQTILDSGKRAVAIVADLLTVAKGVASMREEVSLNRLINEYLESPECLNTKRYFPNGTIQAQLAADLRPILASAVHIKKCLMNLVNNAVEAMHGEGRITLSTWNETIKEQGCNGHRLESGDYVVLQVEDTGPGIAAKDIEHIFEPFYTKKMMGKRGTGLGLTVVWNTAKEHAGKVFVESDGPGTTFTLYFPACAQTDSGARKPVAVPLVSGRGERILVVDDEPHLRDIACQMLQEAGYSASAVASGEAAIEAVAAEPVDLLLIDMLMEPGLDGCQTYLRICNRYPGQKALIASGFSESDDVKTALQLGVSGFINKPYSMERLCRAVHQALNEGGYTNEP